MNTNTQLSINLTYLLYLSTKLRIGLPFSLIRRIQILKLSEIFQIFLRFQQKWVNKLFDKKKSGSSSNCGDEFSLQYRPAIKLSDRRECKLYVLCGGFIMLRRQLESIFKFVF